MHPDMMRELMNQQASEARARAHKARTARAARAARKLARARRDLAEVPRTFTVPEQRRAA
ncbi:MAG: hypothetical protein J2P25_07270 [Nocardiopsaceae bacterium]|nr:hypothetical protein [Nocardiopsaceae bacterium]